jgi:hypothetical protein
MSDALTRLPPQTLIDLDDPTMTQPERARRLWASAKVRTETVRSLASSTILLARLWASAWRVGRGRDLDAAKLRAFTEAEVQRLYRTKSFAPALTLAQMASSGRFVVP